MVFTLYYTASREGLEAEVFAVESILLPSVRAAVARARQRFHSLLIPVHSCLIVWNRNGVHQHHIVKNTKEA